jgi:hypothetical protein
MSERAAALEKSVRIGAAAIVFCVAGLALAWSTAAPAQLAPRLSAQVAIDELTTAQTTLDPPAGTTADASLTSVKGQLSNMAQALRNTMGSDAVKPVELVGDGLRASIVRAHAAAVRVSAYVAASAKCQGSDVAAMQSALADGIALLASASDAAKQVPVIDGVETMEHQPLFAVHQGSGPLAFALIGANLADAQCADPRVNATDEGGRALPTQPTLTGASPARIELRWPDAGSLQAGSVVLHVSAQHKAFLIGCTALPQASAVIRIAPLPRLEVSYSLDAVCAGAAAPGGVVSLGKGKLPALVGQGATASLPVDTSACVAPQSYRLSATVTRSDGSHASVGPFTQSAQASITAGLPGGLSLSWKPEVKTLFVSSGVAVCHGVH